MNTQRIVKFFEQHRATNEPMVLATVVDTGGSTYSKAGELMLVVGDGNFCGMLSGGCLEGDIVERSKSVLLENLPQTASYDLSPDDELWGLGVGCEGTMQVYLQPLTPENQYEPFTSISKVLNGREPADITISEDYCLRFWPSPTLLVMGAGPDSEPLVKIAAELGWRCTVVDHRPAYIDSREFGDSIQAICMQVDELHKNLDLEDFDLAVVMSHHLVSDRSYLNQLAITNIGYVGLLGPPRRRDRLLGDLGDVAERLKGRLSAPAGIQLGGRGPGPISVEIIAEMLQHLAASRDH